MLELSNASEIAELWDSLELKAELPCDPEEFFGKTGSKAEYEQREFDRHYLRCQAVIRRELDNFAVYMKDCSRAGMGLVSPVQLFPRERIQLWLKPERSYSLEVIRCRRVKASCYECGTIFLLK